MSGGASGNVKEDGIRAIEQHSHFEIHGDAEIMGPMDRLLFSFIEQGRMKLQGTPYVAVL